MSALIKLPPVYRGDTWTKKFTVTLEGALTDCDIRMQIREKIDLPVVIALAVGSGITKLSATEFEVELTSTQTASLNGDFSYFADVEFTLPNGKIETLKNLDKRLFVEADVTHD